MRDQGDNGMSNALADAMTEYHDAREALVRAEGEARAASMKETAARNRVNDAQKKIDTILDELRKSAPRDSNWQRSVIEQRFKTPA